MMKTRFFLVLFLMMISCCEDRDQAADFSKAGKTPMQKRMDQKRAEPNRPAQSVGLFQEPRDLQLHSHLSMATVETRQVLLSLELAKALRATGLDDAKSELITRAEFGADVCLAGRSSILDYYDEVISNPESDPERVEMMKGQRGRLDQSWREIEAFLATRMTLKPEDR